MLNLGLYFPRVLYPIRSTQSLFLGYFSEITINLIWPCTLTMSFHHFRIRRNHIYINMLIPRLYNCWWRINSFESHIGNKESHMFYIDRVIKFSAFFRLLWKYTLLVHYKLIIFRPPRVNHFGFCAMLFGCYARFILVDKIVFMVNLKPCLMSVHWCHRLLWHCCCSVINSDCSLSN